MGHTILSHERYRGRPVKLVLRTALLALAAATFAVPAAPAGATAPNYHYDRDLRWWVHNSLEQASYTRTHGKTIPKPVEVRCYSDSTAFFPNHPGESTLPGQSKHVGNVAGSYEKGGFYGRVGVNFHVKELLAVRKVPDDQGLVGRGREGRASIAAEGTTEQPTVVAPRAAALLARC